MRRPVLDAVAERAALVCKAPFARVLLADGDQLRVATEHSVDGTVLARTTGAPLRRTSITGRAILDRAIIHHVDILPLLDTEFPDARENALRLGFRAVLAVPLMLARPRSPSTTRACSTRRKRRSSTT